MKKTKTPLSEFFAEFAKFKDISRLPLNTQKMLISLFEKEAGEILKKRSAVDLQKINSRLAGAYRSFIQGGFKTSNGGLSAWKLKKLNPKLFAELKRRVYATTEAVEGQPLAIITALKLRLITSLSSDKPKTIKALKEALRFTNELRKRDKYTQRLITDQTRKMLGSFNNIIAEEHKAIGFVWRGRRDIREVGNPSGLYPKGNEAHGNHWERNNKFYFYKDNWAVKQGLINTKAKGFAWADFHDGLPSVAVNCRCVAYNYFDLKLIWLDIDKNLFTKKGLEFIGV